MQKTSVDKTHRRTAARVRQRAHRNTVNLLQHRPLHQFQRAARAIISPPRSAQMVAVARRHVDVVQHGDHREIAFAAQALDERQHLNRCAMSSADVGSSSSRQRLSCATIIASRALALAAGQAVHRAVGERRAPPVKWPLRPIGDRWRQNAPARRATDSGRRPPARAPSCLPPPATAAAGKTGGRRICCPTAPTAAD